MSEPKRPNILWIVSDQERHRGWIPPGLVLPHRQRLMDTGLEFTRYYTHSSPCSPSRASLFTGLYVPQHGVGENVIFPYQRALDPALGTVGSRLRRAGYRTAYLGKWHLQHGPHPHMESYGFSDWEGNDQHYMGWAGTGWDYDPEIAGKAVRWLETHARGQLGEERAPWLLTVALVNPHDVMWFPADQPAYQRAHPDELERTRMLLGFAQWKPGDPLPPFTEDYPRVFDKLPPNFHDDLTTKPAVQKQWRDEQNNTLFGRIEDSDTDSWLRQLDYYWRLHQEGDRNLGLILDALERSGAAADTVVVFTSDHGDMCGSHKLRAKGPFVYEEIFHLPFYVRAPGTTRAGSQTAALASHVDLARTLVDLGGGDNSGMPGMDLRVVWKDPNAAGRDNVLLVQEQSWYESCIPLRYASRALFDGRFKFARYYGCGGGFTQIGQPWEEPRRYDFDAAFEDQEYELYDLHEDPHELRNLASDGAHAPELRDRFEHLREQELKAWGPT